MPSSDPGDHSGGGAERLRAAGIDVEGGVLGDDARALLESWLTSRALGRPHVTVKWAQSLDGRAAAADGTSKWITGPGARADVHRRRAEADAIVVGTGTVLTDDPALTARTDDALLPAPARAGRDRIPRGSGRRARAAASARPARSMPATISPRRSTTCSTAACTASSSRAARPSRARSSRAATRIVCSPTSPPPCSAVPAPRSPMIGVGTISQQRRLEIESIDRLGVDLLIVSRPDSESESH